MLLQSVGGGGSLYYAFPPFALVGLVLQKMVMDSAELILVVPKWPTQSWYAFLRRYMVQEPMEVPLQKDVLRLKDVDGRLYDKQHARMGKMSLLVCHMKA